MTWWPEEVAKEFNGRPFNSALDDDKGRYLFIYQQNFADQVKELMKTVDPVTINRDGTVTGGSFSATARSNGPSSTKGPTAKPLGWLRNRSGFSEPSSRPSARSTSPNPSTRIGSARRSVR